MSENLVHTVCADSFEMEYAQIGCGDKPLVIIPGLSIKSVMKSAASLEGPFKIFKDNYTLYFFDRKKEAKIGYSLEEMADDQVAALKAMGIENADVYGVSQGGMIAQYMAIRHPGVVHKLVLGSSTSKAEPRQITTIQNWARLARAHDASALVNAFIDDCFTESFATRYRRALLALYKEVSDEEMERFAIFADACDDVNTYDDLGKIKCPVLVLGAGKDLVTTPEASAKLAEKLKAEGVPCDFFMYQDNGHAVFDELPDYKKRILEFLER
jgi:pimeloyl-ACP methyl ester carboxylesterase